MVDVPQARVRVSPTRLKKLKKIISVCDREIQRIDADIRFRQNIVIPITGHWRSKSDLQIVQNFTKSLKVRRRQLDEKRKAARMELKGYLPLK